MMKIVKYELILAKLSRDGVQR